MNQQAQFEWSGQDKGQAVEVAAAQPAGAVDVAARLHDLRERARNLAAASKAENSIRAYRSDWRNFAEWCAAHGLQSLPATENTLAQFLANRTTSCKPSTIARQVVAISRAHAAAGHPSPAESEAVRAVLAGIRRSKGTAPGQKRPLLPATLRQIVREMPEGLRGLRDAAVLLLGFGAALRRSELAGLNVEDCEFCDEGLIIVIRRSKTDQAGAGRKIGVPRLTTSEACPVAAVRAWLGASGITSGPLFRGIDPAGRIMDAGLSDRSIALIVKRHLPEDVSPDEFSGHSLRAGFATAAAAGGASLTAIMSQTGHRSVAIATRYIREGNLFRQNALGATGL